MTEPTPPANRFVRLLEIVQKTIVATMVVLLLAVLVVAVVDLWKLFFERVGTSMSRIESSGDFQELLQNAFGGILVVFVGLELLETMRSYFDDHHVRVEVIIFVAIIATGRHIIGTEVHGTDPLTFVGLGALMIALSGSYYLIKRGTNKEPPRG